MNDLRSGMYDRSQLAMKLKHRAREFDIERTADRFVGLYEKVVRARP